jgi:hypothetical protein
MSRKAELQEGRIDLIVVPLIQTHPLWMLLGWLWTLDDDTLDGSAHQFHIVALGSLNHHFDRHSMAFGQQTAFHAPFATVGGIGPGFFPTQGRFGHRPVHTQPLPVKPTQLIKLLDSSLPQLEKDACFHLCLKPIVRCRMGTQLGLIKGLPLAGSSQHREDRVGTVPVCNARSPASKAMRIDVDGQEWLQHGPQFIGDAKPGGGPVIRRALPFSFLAFLFAHTSYSSRLFGWALSVHDTSSDDA